jgi:hypothetical protein
MRIYFLTTLLMGFTLFTYSQVGIGTPNPHSSAKLEVNSDSKGFLCPRMTNTQRTGITSPATGLLVFQTDGAAGFYYYTGSEWKQLSNVTSTSATMSTLDFANTKLEPSTYTSGSPYTGVLKIPYTGGNGGTFAGGGTSISSTGVTGLSATLQAGTLNYGSGELIYDVSGTPSASSPNAASFAIPTTLTATGGTAVVGRGTVINIGETISSAFTIAGATAASASFNLATHVGANNVPTIEGLQANLVGLDGNFYKPRIYNTSQSTQTISIQTDAPSVNQYKTALNLTINSGSSVDVDTDGAVWWSTSQAETITTNVQVPVGSSYRWYEFRWWCMQVGTDKIIFIAVTRLL